MNLADKILVLGARGLVGSALLAQLKKQGYSQLLHPLREELDLFHQKDVEDYFSKHKPDFVFLAAAKVGGIEANNRMRADFIFQNLQIQQNVFNAAFREKTKNLLFLASSCIYPKNAPQPLKEEYLLSLPLEPTNEPYAIAKIAGLKTTESFRRQYGLNWFSVLPTNLYGINDNFDENNSHVIPGLIARLIRAKNQGDKVFKAWGTGKPRREFLFVDDLARACVHFMNYSGNKPDYINIGAGVDIEISELVKIIASKIDFKGQIQFDDSKPDGTMKKLLDISKISEMGWKPQVSLDEGLDLVIQRFKI